MTNCDWCSSLLNLVNLFNVTYLTEQGNETGFSNVLCANCLEQVAEPAEYWNSVTSLTEINLG